MPILTHTCPSSMAGSQSCLMRQSSATDLFGSLHKCSRAAVFTVCEDTTFSPCFGHSKRHAKT